MKRSEIRLLAAFAVIASATGAFGRTAVEPNKEAPPAAALTPAYCNVEHNVGKIGLGISNDGTFGVSFSVTGSSYDCFTGEYIYSCEYPRGSRTRYLFGAALWIGAVVGSDTLVSTATDGWSTPGHEYHPDEPPVGEMMYRSTLNPDLPTFEGAVSEQDYIAIYADTCLNCIGVTPDQVDQRPHRPLNVEITQSSFAWSYPHTEDFVFIDYAVKNIGVNPLSEVYLGVYVDADIHDLAYFPGGGAQDDMTGYFPTAELPTGIPDCEAEIDLGLAWAADNDGDLGQVVFNPVPHVTATMVVQTPSESPQNSYNWWVSYGDPSLDFGPMRRAAYRDFGTGGMGTPVGDRNKYYLLSNGDIDYDQVRVASIGGADSIWLPPPAGPVLYWSIGMDTRYLLSCGPFDIEPGETVPITLVYVAGENLHTDEANFDNLPYNPDAFTAGLDFTDLTTNALWAEWVFDNPGIDSDSDGYKGEFAVCDLGDGVVDTVWYRGDGVPDWRATGTPASPDFWLEPRPGGLYARWNGFKSETTVDWASRLQDFEGYNLYLSTSGDLGSFARIGTYDVEDYFRYYWDMALNAWRVAPERLTLEETLCAYAGGGCSDPVWHPLDYTRSHPYVMPGYPDSIFYFEPIMANASEFGLETPFVKRFPAAPEPEYDSPDDVPPELADLYLTDDGYFKYYEYEYLIAELLPGETYWVAVAAFDYGSLTMGSPAEESPVIGTAQTGVPLPYSFCCHGTVGNADCDEEEHIGIGDVSVMIDYLYISGRPLCCPAEADINQSGGSQARFEDITLGDIAILIDYLFITGTSMGLPDCF